MTKDSSYSSYSSPYQVLEVEFIDILLYIVSVCALYVAGRKILKKVLLLLSSSSSGGEQQREKTD